MWHSRPRLWVQRLNALLMQTRRAEALPDFLYRNASAQNKKEETPGAARGVENLAPLRWKSGHSWPRKGRSTPLTALPKARAQRQRRAHKVPVFEIA